MNELLRLSATHQAALIREGKISSAELVQAHLEQIGRLNREIHAAVSVFPERVLESAWQADEASAHGQSRGPLHGVPFSVKDSIEVEDTVCTGGTWGRREAAPSAQDATVVARLRAAGAIPIAKTNLPDLLFAFETDNLIFGRTNNPYDQSRTPGGSSGGEAALIAACGSPCGIGSDAAGSVRLPASFCGIAGIKPTSGRLPRTGHFPPAGGWIERLWQIGPMARHVEDLCTMMPLLARGDGQDFSVVDMRLPDPRSVNLRSLRIAFYTANGIVPTAPEVSNVIQAAARALESEVASVEEAKPSCLTETYHLEMQLLGADGGDSLREYLKQIGSDRLHPLLSGWLDKLERYRTGIAGFARYWAEYDLYRAEMVSFFQNYDVIVCPAYTQPALPHGASILDENFRGFSHTMAHNLTGWPAAVVRCGASREGLPIAAQIAAHPFREEIALAIALRLEEALGGWKEPALAAAGAPVMQSE